MPDAQRKTRPSVPPAGDGGDAPRPPDIEKPDIQDLLKRMKKVSPDQAKRYRQRTGQ